MGGIQLSALGNSLQKWRWDVIAVGAASLIIWLVSTPSSAYFLQIDTAAQDYVALAMVRGCWEFFTEKMLAVLLLVPLYALFGPSPYWETILLAVALSFSTVAVFEMTRTLTNSAIAGVLAALIFTAMPAVQFFARTYFGYLTLCLSAGWLSCVKQRWTLAGICFGCAIIAHFNALVPVGISILLLFRDIRLTNWKSWLAFALALAAPVLIVEAVFFLYLGAPFAWTQGTFGMVSRFSGVVSQGVGSDWLWLIRSIIDSNGWVMALALLPGLFTSALLLRQKAAPFIGLCGLLLAIFFTVQAGIGRSLMVSRSFVAAYPLWCAGSAIVIYSAITQLRAANGRRLAQGLLTGLLGLTVIQTSVYIRQFTQTPYPEIETWFLRAAETDRPVRYNGNMRIALFHAHNLGVELLVNDERWMTAGAPGQAVLMFTGSAPVALSRDGYTIAVSDVASTVDSWFPLLTVEAATPRHVELWWPSEASEPVRPATPPDAANDAAFYYSGSGCLTPPPYNDGRSWFYQLLLEKVGARLKGSQ